LDLQNYTLINSRSVLLSRILYCQVLKPFQRGNAATTTTTMAARGRSSSDTYSTVLYCTVLYCTVLVCVGRLACLAWQSQLATRLPHTLPTYLPGTNVRALSPAWTVGWFAGWFADWQSRLCELNGVLGDQRRL